MREKITGGTRLTSFLEIPRIEQEKPTPSTIIYAGTSTRRRMFLEYAFPAAKIVSVSGGLEAEIPDAMQIMRDKLRFALPKAAEIAQKSHSKTGILIASDVISRTLAVDADKITYLANRGKPKSTIAIKNIFEQMSMAGKISGMNPYYTVEAASGVLDLKSNELNCKTHTCTIELSPEKIDFLKTNEGFETYVNNVKDYFSSADYLNNGIYTKTSIQDIAGGLDLAVLAKLGAIVSIDNIKRDNPDFKHYLEYALFHSAIGLHATTLKPYNANINRAITQCPWLQTITAYAVSA